MTKSITSPRIALLAILIWLAAGFNTIEAKVKPEIPFGFQPGYIITLENDTIHGLVEFGTSRNSHLRCRFMHSVDDEVQTFGPRELNGYGFGQKLVFNTKAIDLNTFLRHANFDITQLQESDEIIHLLQHFDYVFSDPESGVEPVLQTAEGKPITLQPLFMEVIVQGEISLYAYSSLYFVQKDEGELYLLRQIKSEVFRNGQTYIIITNEYLGVLNYLTRNCPQVNAGVMGTKFSLNAFRNLIVSYNQCTGNPFWISNEKIPKVKINPGISLITESSTLSFKTNPNMKPASARIAETVTTVYPGLYFDIMFPKTSNRINFALGAQLWDVEFNDYSFVEQTTSIKKSNQASLRQSYLKIPLELHYKPFRSNLHPSLMAGVNLNYTLKDDHIYKITISDNISGEELSVSSQTFHTRKAFNPGLVFGADMRKSLGSQFYLVAGVRYELASSIFSIENYDQKSLILTGNSRLQSFSIQLSLLMNLTDFYK
ncbi:MAG: hypothetical protein EA361_02815 [Bacteroidetes bacterium]|nr:MAG: hypothetical protein EA361_02815 [Bacteroidota bacterium]